MKVKCKNRINEMEEGKPERVQRKEASKKRIKRKKGNVVCVGLLPDCSANKKPITLEIE